MNAPLSVKFKNDLENDLHADPHEAWFGICSSFEEEINEAKSAIKSAYWQLLPFLKPGDEKTKAVLQELQRFM